MLEIYAAKLGIKYIIASSSGYLANKTNREVFSNVLEKSTLSQDDQTKVIEFLTWLLRHCLTVYSYTKDDSPSLLMENATTLTFEFMDEIIFRSLNPLPTIDLSDISGGSTVTLHSDIVASYHIEFKDFRIKKLSIDSATRFIRDKPNLLMKRTYKRETVEINASRKMPSNDKPQVAK